MKKVTIIAKPAQPYMVSEYPFKNHDMLSDEMCEVAKSAMRYQIIKGHALLIEAHVNDDEHQEIVVLALAGILVSDDDKNIAEIWFAPTVDMPRFRKSLLVALPRLIRGLMLVGGCTRALTLVMAEGPSAKKFAKLCKFNYSSNLKIKDIQFEEWEFGDYRG
jgi:hypothetical protein